MIERLGDATLYTGDVLEVLRGLPDESVHCIVTSPPYLGLRDYGIEPSVWDDPSGCAHEWGEAGKMGGGAHGGRSMEDVGQATQAEREQMQHASTGAFCRLCGAWRGAHGLEPTPELYVAHEMQVFREVRRVLRADGTLWLNLGQSYAGSGKGSSNSLNKGNPHAHEAALTALTMRGTHSIEDAPTSWLQVPPGLKAKDLIAIPWLVALALQADGWFLRSACPWIKRNPMPESATDRPATAVEYIFLLSKSGRYWYDSEAVRKGVVPGTLTDRVDTGRFSPDRGFPGATDHGNGRLGQNPGGTRSRRNSDWFFESWQGLLSDEEGDPLAFVVNPKGFKGAHFATFPPRLVSPMILAGCPEHACPGCGAPWVREVQRDGHVVNGRGPKDLDGRTSRMGGGAGWRKNAPVARATVSEHPTCACALAPVGGTVLDPFAGSGTTGMVALEYGRRAILIECKPEYVEMQRKRLRPVAERPLLAFGGSA